MKKDKFRVIECSVCGKLNIFPSAMFKRNKDGTFKEAIPVKDFVRNKHCGHMMLDNNGVHIVDKKGIEHETYLFEE